MIEGLRACVRERCEVILLVRGGGSFEDLMPFNDEMLARAVAACPVPVVTGIGHEPDTSIADMVSDLRASTPTAAAEAVSPDTSLLQRELSAKGASMGSALQQRLERARMTLDKAASRPVLRDPASLFATELMTIDVMQDRLARALPENLAKDALRLQALQDRMKESGAKLTRPFEHAFALKAGRLHDLSPLGVLARGYAVAKDQDGGVVKSVQGVSPGGSLEVLVSDGTISCTVEDTKPAQ